MGIRKIVFCDGCMKAIAKEPVASIETGEFSGVNNWNNAQFVGNRKTSYLTHLRPACIRKAMDFNNMGKSDE